MLVLNERPNLICRTVPFTPFTQGSINLEADLSPRAVGRPINVFKAFGPRAVFVIMNFHREWVIRKILANSPQEDDDNANYVELFAFSFN